MSADRDSHLFKNHDLNVIRDKPKVESKIGFKKY